MDLQTEETIERMGVLIDRLDSLTYSLNMPVPDSIHVKGMRGSLPDIVDQMKLAYDDLRNLLED